MGCEKSKQTMCRRLPLYSHPTLLNICRDMDDPPEFPKPDQYGFLNQQATGTI
jgi:hypothetical protein